LISKVPHDVFRLEGLRHFYAHREARLRILLVLRDPRDVLTSQRKTGGPEGYVVSPGRWQRYFRAYIEHRHDPDVLEVRYEDLVSSITVQQSRIERFLDLQMQWPFEQFHEVDRPDFDTSTLNGLRPVERSLVSRWAAEQHRPRIELVLRELPELPQALIDLGYERDAGWIRQWQIGTSERVKQRSRFCNFSITDLTSLA
jgi:hypothetical protein